MYETVINQKCIELKEFLFEYQNKNGLPPEPASTLFFVLVYELTIIELLIKVNRIDLLTDAYADILKIYYDGDHTYILDEIPVRYIAYILAANVGSSIGVLVQWIKNNMYESPEDLVTNGFFHLRTHSLQIVFETQKKPSVFK
ncbi:hypothetical protein BSK60_23850 [Paenibacillus odorifer]|nr:hypothetical protein BSK60_23850 [Paenibacillus odorifer]